ncbi:MAG: hypothetical protein ACLPSW_21780 [Roseiarcus sp.]
MRNRLLAAAAIAVIGVGSLVALGAARADDTRAQDQARALELGVPYTDFNWNTAHAQFRGCSACHTDLAAEVSNLSVARTDPGKHGVFFSGYAPMRVEDCLICHGVTFAEPIHSLHLLSTSFGQMGGNCETCHAMVAGKFVLYDDETRYSVLNGVSHSPTPAFSP